MSHWLDKYHTQNTWDNSYQEPWHIRIWKAALARAYSDLLSANSQSDARDFRTAQDWILKDLDGTFGLCCDTLDISDAHIKELRRFASNAVYHGFDKSLIDYQQRYRREQHRRTYTPRPRLNIVVLTPEQRRAKARAMYKLRCAQAKALKSA